VLRHEDRAGLWFELNHAARLVIRRTPNDALYTLDPDGEGVLCSEDEGRTLRLLRPDGQQVALNEHKHHAAILPVQI